MNVTDVRLLNASQHDADQGYSALTDNLSIPAPTALRRIRRLRDAGLIARQVALLDEDLIAQVQGHGLTAVTEVSLDHQGAELLDAFERCAISETVAHQCYRVSSGPNFILVLRLRDMPAYHQLAERLFTQDANMRNVRTFFPPDVVNPT